MYFKQIGFYPRLITSELKLKWVWKNVSIIRLLQDYQLFHSSGFQVFCQPYPQLLIFNAFLLHFLLCSIIKIQLLFSIHSIVLFILSWGLEELERKITQILSCVGLKYIGVCVCILVGGQCCVACGILVPQPGIKLGPVAVRAQSLNHGSTREVPHARVLYFRMQRFCYWL